MPALIVFVVALSLCYMRVGLRALFENVPLRCVCCCVLFGFLFIYPKGGRPKSTLPLNGGQKIGPMNYRGLDTMCRNQLLVVNTCSPKKAHVEHNCGTSKLQSTLAGRYTNQASDWLWNFFDRT
jgi:hypothetical protein